MWGIPTLNRLNNEAAEAAEIMKRKGFAVPKIERSQDAPAEVHEYKPLDAPACCHPGDSPPCDCAHMSV